MKFCFLVLVLLIASCGTKKQNTPTVFVPGKICSERSLAYLEKTKPKDNVVKPAYSESEIQPYLIALAPLVQQCYRAELERKVSDESFPLCLVVGLDKRGNKEFFEFSNKERNFSDQFNKCLKGIEKLAGFQNLKNLSILQPYNLHPVREIQEP